VRVAICMRTCARVVMLQLACAKLRMPVIMLNYNGSIGKCQHFCVRSPPV
jgi:acyl-CoA synthetase (AMP-forming)/AMP-acid ligase II